MQPQSSSSIALTAKLANCLIALAKHSCKQGLQEQQQQQRRYQVAAEGW
jgi:hypothetical protein